MTSSRLAVLKFLTIALGFLWIGLQLKTPIAFSQEEQVKTKEARWHYNRGADFLEAQRYDDCIQESKQATQLDPTLDGAFCNLGACYLKEDMLKEALEALSRAYTMNPQRAATRQNLAFVYEAIGEFEKAKELWKTLPPTPDTFDDRVQRRLYDLVVKDALSDQDLTWLQRVAESQSSQREGALIRLGMFLMAHPESADTLVPKLIGLYRTLGKKEGAVIVGLLGGNSIRLHVPSNAERGIALIAPEFRGLQRPTALTRETGGPSPLPEVLRTDEDIIEFLCSVGPTGPSYYDPYFLLGRFKGARAQQCLAEWFEHERDDKQRLVLTGSLLRLGDARGLRLILEHLRKNGQADERDIEAAAATDSESLHRFFGTHLVHPWPQELFFRERYFRGDLAAGVRLWKEVLTRARDDVDAIYDLCGLLGDEVREQGGMGGQLTGLRFTTRFLVEMLASDDTAATTKALQALNLLAELRTDNQTHVSDKATEWIVERLAGAAKQLPADTIPQDTAAWKAWLDRHQAEFPGGVPSETARGPYRLLEPISIDEGVIGKLVAEIEGLKEDAATQPSKDRAERLLSQVSVPWWDRGVPVVLNGWREDDPLLEERIRANRAVLIELFSPAMEPALKDVYCSPLRHRPC